MVSVIQWVLYLGAHFLDPGDLFSRLSQSHSHRRQLFLLTSADPCRPHPLAHTGLNRRLRNMSLIRGRCMQCHSRPPLSLWKTNCLVQRVCLLPSSSSSSSSRPRCEPHAAASLEMRGLSVGTSALTAADLCHPSLPAAPAREEELWNINSNRSLISGVEYSMWREKERFSHFR